MFDVMLSGPQPISTLLVIKPRAVKKHLTKILRKVMLEGFTMVGLRLGLVSQDEELVSLIDEEGELVSLIRYPSTKINIEVQSSIWEREIISTICIRDYYF